MLSAGKLTRLTNWIDRHATVLVLGALVVAVASSLVPIDLTLPVLMLALACAMAAALVQFGIWRVHGTKSERVRAFGSLLDYWDYQFRLSGMNWAALLLVAASLGAAAALALAATSLSASVVLALGAAMLAIMVAGFRRTWPKR